MSERVWPAEIQGASIVALGSFNPAILQPLWFATHGLLLPEEAENADVSVVHKEIAIFRTAWLSLQAIDDRFSVQTTDPTKYLPLRDLAVGTFSVLEHTPIHAFGFNTDQHFRIGDEKHWNAFGDHYAPKNSWRDVVTRPGMRSLTMQGKGRNALADHVQVKIEPSPQLEFGVYVHVNEHFGPRGPNGNPENRHAEFLRMLQLSWTQFHEYSNSVAQHLLNRAASEGSEA